MKCFIRKRTNFLYDFMEIPDGLTHEEKQHLNNLHYGTTEYIEIDRNDIYPFGCLKSEFENYKNSNEYNPQNFLLPGEIEI